ncbi:hypothetical protein KBY97_07805 [Synechococcus sp. ATX 2A4]|uniref:hypothetical protein n=1 Tax=Synechococcus sp. ATX 2A4 TaxID=2823727 RepID=UPI0020CB7589|nr:hypothetical protein [Synechococcus sp. ATX 2A4]MCP9885031.1 hypothetical protein [Synechococcus sp. ATX 2A4]
MGLALHWLMLAISFYLFYGIGLRSILALHAYQSSIHPLLAQRRPKFYAVGTYAAAAQNTAPISHTACLRWRVVVKEAKGRFNQTTLLNHRSIQPFTIHLHPFSQPLRVEERSPSWLQEIESLAAFQPTAHQYCQHLFRSLNPDVIAFLEQHRISQWGRLGLRRSLTVTESHWKEGDPVYLFGEMKHTGHHWWIDADLVSDMPRETLLKIPVLMTVIGGIVFLYTLITLF